MASTSVCPGNLAPLFDMNSALGPPFVGTIVSTLLFGVSILQVYIYYHKFPNDRVIYKASAAILLVLDALNLALTVHFVYHYLISNFGNYLAMTILVWSFKYLKLRSATDLVIIFMAHCLYCMRVWKLNYRKRMFPRLLPLLVIVDGALGIVLIVKTYRIFLLQDMIQLRWIICTSMSLVVVTDFAITGAMCYCLNQSRSDFAATNSEISILILWTINTGLVPSVFSLVAFLTYAAMPESLIFLSFDFILAKLYFNSLLAMLNARTSMSREAPHSVNILNNPARSLDRNATKSTLPFSSRVNVNDWEDAKPVSV